MRNKNYDISSILLYSFVIITLITNISTRILTKHVDSWFEGSIVLYAIFSLNILQFASYILPALAIRNKTYKIIGVIVASILVLYLIYEQIYAIILLVTNR